ncbi:hypothetical protein EV426DRAFT_571936 [Tirmania nivea]|nr:hypothetical protein EV426DRAFT_571936 [Tirmania nivea]
MRIGHKRSKKRPSTKRSQTSRAIAIPKSTAAGATDGTTGPSQPLRLMDSSGADKSGSSDQEPSSGTSSEGSLTVPLTPTPRYGFLCFRKRSPRTLVDGRYREHDPTSLPEPFKWGFIQWARSVKKRPNKPLDDAETLYNNRTLRFWRLSTDYGRFLKHEDDEAQGDVDDASHDDNTVYEVVNGPPSFWTSPQRPYTAPPHQMNRSPC